jgi:hypothetical protein
MTLDVTHEYCWAYECIRNVNSVKIVVWIVKPCAAPMADRSSSYVEYLVLGQARSDPSNLSSRSHVRLKLRPDIVR